MGVLHPRLMRHTQLYLIEQLAEEPLRQIANNAGLEGSVVVEKVRNLPKGQGLNAQTEEYGDLVKQGVVDPVKTTRSALQNASSIASMVLTTEALIAEKPEKKPAGGGGGGGGMDDYDMESYKTFLQSAIRVGTRHPALSYANRSSTLKCRSGRVTENTVSPNLKTCDCW